MSSKTWVLSLAVLCVAGQAWAGKVVVLGPAYPIAEPDTLQEIRAAIAGRDWSNYVRREPSTYTAFQSTALPRAEKTASHLFDPTYLLPEDVRDAEGKVLFPKGLPINVYNRIKVPGRYIVIGDSQEDFDWLLDVARPGPQDKVLLAGGNTLLARQQRGVPVYTLDARFIERFGLRAVPSIVQQEGTQLRVSEFRVDHKEAKP
jgi:conjugal transfer pilus assembly protein TraW